MHEIIKHSEIIIALEEYKDSLKDTSRTIQIHDHRVMLLEDLVSADGKQAQEDIEEQLELIFNNAINYRKRKIKELTINFPEK